MRTDTGEQGGVAGVAWSPGSLSGAQREAWLEEGLESLHLGLWGSVKVYGQGSNTVRPRLGKSSGESEKEGSGSGERGGWLVAPHVVLDTSLPSLRAALFRGEWHVLQGHRVPRGSNALPLYWDDAHAKMTAL